MKLHSQPYLAFPGKRGSVTFTEIPSSSEFAEKEGKDGVSFDQTTAGEKGKKALVSQALKNTMFFMCIYEKNMIFPIVGIQS